MIEAESEKEKWIDTIVETERCAYTIKEESAIWTGYIYV